MTALALQNSFSALLSFGSYRVGFALARADDSDGSRAGSFTEGSLHDRNLARAAQGSERGSGSPVLEVERSVEVVPVQTLAAVPPPAPASETYRPSHLSRGPMTVIKANVPKGQFVDTRV